MVSLRLNAGISDVAGLEEPVSRPGAALAES